MLHLRTFASAQSQKAMIPAVSAFCKLNSLRFISSNPTTSTPTCGSCAFACATTVQAPLSNGSGCAPASWPRTTTKVPPPCCFIRGSNLQTTRGYCTSSDPSNSKGGTGSSAKRSTTAEECVQETLKDIREKTFIKVTDPEDLKHFRLPTVKSKVLDIGQKPEEPPIGTDALPHPIWSEKEMDHIIVTHKKPITFVDKLAYFSVKLLRFGFDVMSGFKFTSKRTERIWVNRLCFLETVAGVPGMVAAMVRHLHSLRRMRRDHGWIHTLLEEAENERMHLMTALQLREPGVVFRTCVVVTQGVFVSFFSVAYMVSPAFCHRFVGYLEEEAVYTYSKLLQDMEAGGPMKHWTKREAPPLAIRYWQLEADANMKDVILAIRADEAHHRVVNHTLASMKPDDYNPYRPGK